MPGSPGAVGSAAWSRPSLYSSVRLIPADRILAAVERQEDPGGMLGGLVQGVGRGAAIAGGRVRIAGVGVRLEARGVGRGDGDADAMPPIEDQRRAPHVHDQL